MAPTIPTGSLLMVLYSNYTKQITELKIKNVEY